VGGAGQPVNDQVGSQTLAHVLSGNHGAGRGTFSGAIMVNKQEHLWRVRCSFVATMGRGHVPALVTVLIVACLALVQLQASTSHGWIDQLQLLLSQHNTYGKPSATTLSAPAVATAAAQPVSMDSSLKELIARLPKAELHIHIEGTLEAAMMLKFAARNNVTLPYANLAEALAARWEPMKVSAACTIQMCVACCCCSCGKFSWFTKPVQQGGEELWNAYYSKQLQHQLCHLPGDSAFVHVHGDCCAYEKPLHSPCQAPRVYCCAYEKPLHFPCQAPRV
jgi:hypothetical protein